MYNTSAGARPQPPHAASSLPASQENIAWSVVGYAQRRGRLWRSASGEPRPPRTSRMVSGVSVERTLISTHRHTQYASENCVVRLFYNRTSPRALARCCALFPQYVAVADGALAGARESLASSPATLMRAPENASLRISRFSRPACCSGRP